jgi:hypothetical protein
MTKDYPLALAKSRRNDNEMVTMLSTGYPHLAQFKLLVKATRHKVYNDLITKLSTGSWE